MRALHVISSIDPVHGGPSEGLNQLGAAIERLGYAFEVVTLDPPQAPFIVSSRFQVNGLGPGIGKYGYCKSLRDWLSAHIEQYDVVVVHGLWQFHDAAVHQLCNERGTPYVIYPHGMLDPWFNRAYPLKHVKKLAYWAFRERAILRDAAAVLYTCEQERLLARNAFPLYAGSDTVVGFGTSVPAVPTPHQVGAFLSKFSELVGKRMVLFMGRIHPKKGLDLLIQAFASAFERDSQWHLVIAGPDQIGWKTALDGQIQKLNIRNRVTWTGMLEGDLKWGALGSADVFVLPSHQENFGVSVVEALGCGVPVLISNQVNIWREIESDGAGLAAPDNLHGACHLLERWASLTTEERQLFRQRARKCFTERFDMRRSAENLIRVLEQVTGTRSGELARA